MKTDEPMKYTMLTAAEALASTEDTATPESETLRLPLKNLVRLLPGSQPLRQEELDKLVLRVSIRSSLLCVSLYLRTIPRGS